MEEDLDYINNLSPNRKRCDYPAYDQNGNQIYNWFCSLGRDHAGDHQAYGGHDLSTAACYRWPNPDGHVPQEEVDEALASILETARKAAEPQ